MILIAVVRSIYISIISNKKKDKVYFKFKEIYGGFELIIHIRADFPPPKKRRKVPR